MSKSRVLTAAELIHVLESHGFKYLRAKGSHRIFKNRTTGKMTVVPMHRGDLPKGTVLGILKQAGIDPSDL